MFGLLRTLPVVRRSAFALMTAAAVITGCLSSGEANAQSGLFVRSRAGCDSFCVGGVQVQVERYDPSGLGHAFCGPRPALILLHGADGLGQYGHVYREAASNLAKAGYSTFIVHYFDVTPDVAALGYVEPSEIKGQRFLAWQAAVSAAMCHVAQQPGIDAGRIGIMGFSLGSYLAVAEAARNPQVAVVVDFFGGVPAEAAKLIRRLPPTLIIHGDQDRIVPVTEALRLRDVLASRGAYHELVIYPGAGHELSGSYKDDAAARVLRFLRCNL